MKLSVPLPGATVDLGVLDVSRWLSASVTDSSDLGMVVTAPGGADLMVRSGDGVTVRWLATDLGVGLLETIVAGTTRGPQDATWLLRSAGRPTVVQRRRHLRVPVTVRVEAGWEGGRQEMITLDLSEGGVRCLAAGPVGLAAGDTVRLAVGLHDQTVAGAAAVVRATPSQGGTTLAFRFTSLTRREADRVRRFVFARDVALGALAR